MVVEVDERLAVIRSQEGARFTYALLFCVYRYSVIYIPKYFFSSCYRVVVIITFENNKRKM